MKILEAGCGRRWAIDLEPLEYELTGVDLDGNALDHRRSVIHDLDIGILGDIRDPDVVPSGYFDVVYSAYVLEHIDGAQTVLENFIEWVRPGGLIVLRLPNLKSVHGWAARHTPYRIHVWVYRYLLSMRNAGKPGFGPYPTYHDSVLAPNALAAFCRDRDLSLQEWFAIDGFSDGGGAKLAAIRSGMRLVSRLSFGRLSDREVDLGMVIRKPAA
jgi:SAM-dependent methyltransferase